MRVTRPRVLFVLVCMLALSSCNGSMGCPVAAASPASSTSCPCVGACVAPAYLFVSAPVTLVSYPVTFNGALGTPTNLNVSALASLHIAAGPLNPYLYQPDIVSRSVLGYSIDLPTGALTAVPGSPFPMASGSQGAVDVAVTPDGSKLYASDFNGSIVSFSINSSGVLGPLVTTSTLSQGLPHSMAIDRLGKFLYSSDPAGRILGYALNADGSLTSLPSAPYALPLNSAPEDLTIDGTGKFVYAALTGVDAVAAFSLDATTGALTPISGSPFAAGDRPESIGVNPNGFLYALNAGSNNVSAYKINADGTLVAVAGSPFPTGAPVNPSLPIPFPGSVAADRAGKTLWIGAPSSNAVTTFTVDGTTGALTFMNLTNLPATTPPGQVAVGFYQP